jgi:hypothetical protein
LGESEHALPRDVFTGAEERIVRRKLVHCSSDSRADKQTKEIGQFHRLVLPGFLDRDQSNCRGAGLA